MSQDIQELERRAAELREIVERPSEREKAAGVLSLIERELAVAKAAEHKAAAEERLIGIKRAHGSVVASLDDDLVRVSEAKAAYEAAIIRANDRYRQVTRLWAEAAALSDRFNLPTPTLPIVVPPAMRKLSTQPSVELVGHLRSKPEMEKDEHGLRQRRTYHEVRGTPGYAIIEAAGLKPFPPLTESQQRAIDSLGRQSEEARRQLAGFPTGY